MQGNLFDIHFCLLRIGLYLYFGFDILGLLGLSLDLLVDLLCIQSFDLKSANKLGVVFLREQTQGKDVLGLQEGKHVIVLIFFEDFEQVVAFLHIIKELQIIPPLACDISPSDHSQSPPYATLTIQTIINYMQVQSARKEQQTSGKRFIKLQSKGVKQQKFEFKTYELAFTVRQVLYEKIIKFDRNGDMHFQQSQIREFLIQIMHEAQTEIHYFIKNVFRYDYNSDGIIEYDELVNFCMEQHLGEIAIQRLHRQKIYSRGSQRQMNEEEFVKTINYALSFLQFKTNGAQLESLFKSVDMDSDGFISYEDYFRFLKEYFGSKSFAAGLVNTFTVIEELKHSGDLKELDIVKKYSKYENVNKNFEGGSGPRPSGSIKNNIINGPGRNTPAEEPKTSPNINNQNNSGSSQGNSNSGGMRASGISSIDAKTIDNSSVSKDADQNSRDSTDKKKRPSINPGIEVTINKQSTRIPKMEDISLNQQETALATRIARLVMTQLKSFLINLDTNKTLRLNYEEIIRFLKVGLNFSQTNISLVNKRGILSKDKKYTYEQAVKAVMSEFISRLFSEITISDPTKAILIQDFVGIFDRVCCIVPNTPLIDKFEQLYRHRVTKNGPFDYNEFQLLIAFIFNEYSFKQ